MPWIITCKLRICKNNLQEPVQPVTRDQYLPRVYKPLKLNYQVVADKPPIPYQPCAKYPVSIQVPEVPVPRSLVKPDPLRGKSYVYNTLTPPSSPSVSILKNYNFNIDVPLSPPS